MATTNTKLEAKLDQVIEVVGDMANKVTRIDTTMIEREKTDNLKYNHLDERIEALEENQKWLVRSIMGSVLTALMGIILNIVK